MGFTAGEKLTSKLTALMGSEHTGGNSYGELLPPKPFFYSGGEAEEMAGAKITGRSMAFVFPNSCPAFQDLEQRCFAVLSQFLLGISCLTGRSWPAV